jgi:hydroxypyruvate isomerase
VSEQPVVTRGNIHQSLVYWCFSKYWDVEKTCLIAKQLGIPAVEIVAPEHWPTLKKHGLVCSLASSHGFDKGMNNPKYWPMCHEKLRAAIDACAEFGFPNVITFTGFREDIPDDVGMKNCVEGFKQECAQAYMIRLEREDFEDYKQLSKLGAVINMSPEQFRTRFGYLITHK